MNLNRPWLIRNEDFLGLVLQRERELAGHTDSHSYTDSRIEIKNGVAVVDVIGILRERIDDVEAWWIEGLSTIALAQKIEGLRRVPGLRDVVFNFSSPGGEVGGVQNAAKAIFSLRDRFHTIAYVNSHACSGAYWMAAACQEIVLASETSEVGSIGVVIAHQEISRLQEKIGIKTTEVTSGDAKRIVSLYEPLSEDGRAALEMRAREIHDVFRKDLMAMRGSLSLEKIGVWGEGSTFVGVRAIENGLADRIEYIPNLFEIGEKSVDLEKLKTDFPQVFEQACQIGRDSAKAEMAAVVDKTKTFAGEQERARVIGILDISIDGYETAKMQAIRDGLSVEQVAVSIVQGKLSRDKKENTLLAAVRTEAPAPVVVHEDQQKQDEAISIAAAVAAANKV